MQTEILLKTIDERSSRPSYFEICIMEQMYKLLKPAVRHFALFVAECTGQDNLVDQFENYYSLFMSTIQWRCLRDSHASLVESFYGLQRVSSGSKSSQRETISSSQKVASLAYIIVLPRIMTYLRDVSKIVRERERYNNGNVPTRSGLGATTYVDVSPQPSLMSSMYEGLKEVQHSCKMFLANAFPYVEFAGDMAVILYQMLYLTGRSEYHHPLFALLGMKLEKKQGKMGEVPRPGASSTSSNGDGGSNNAFSNWPVVVVLSLVLAVRAAEYLRSNSSDLEASSLSTRLAVPLPIPPVPQPAKIGRGCVVPPLDASLCALCGHTRTNSCASNSGYVFCYMCILPYVRDHNSCPVSGLYCQESDIIRLFEESPGVQSRTSTTMIPCVFLASLAVVAVASPSSDYLDWVVKSVCVDSRGFLLKVDPYPACPPGSTSRKLRAGDPLPYNNFEQMGYQISDSSVLFDKHGQPLLFHNFDYEPFNEFNQHSGSDGYDVYSLISNTVSVSNTKDGGGYGSTFYGKNCAYGNGWALFPQTNFLIGGQGYWPIMGVYWEHNGVSSPGHCPSSYSTNTLTSWELVPGFTFSGVNSNPTKFIDALMSYHGFETEKNGVTPTSNFLANGHLEVFYFTELYGLTRWEVWKPVTSEILGAEPVRGSAECSGTGVGTYKGISFVITDCHDWSNVKPVPGSGEIPQWPLVNANLVQYSHFEASGLSETYQVGKWGRFGSSPAGYLINWSALVSTGGGDVNDGTGVAYLAFNCAAGSDNKCGTTGSQAVYQDIPVDSLICGDCAYLFGANVRTAPGDGAGTLQIALQIISTAAVSAGSAGNDTHTAHNVTSHSGTVLASSVVWSQSFEETVQEDNGDGRGNEKDSVYLSVKFIRRTTVLPASVINSATPGSLVLRFLLLPVTAHTFQVVDTFFNRFPLQTSNLAD